MYFKYPIIDTHIHVGDIEEINKAVKKAEYEQYVLLSGSINPKCVWGNLELLDIKKKAPEKIYAYACLHKTGEGAPEADELLRQATVSAKERVNVDANIIPSQKNKEIISILYGQGIFKLKDSVIKIADILGISKNTVYLHLRALQKK